MAYSFDQIFAADPSNPSNVAQNAAVTIFAPGDSTMTPLTITDPDGQPLSNPIPVNANGFGSAFAHATLDRVAWAGGGFTGFFTSYEGMKGEAVAAREAAETAAASAATEATIRLDELIAAGSFEGPAGPLTNLTVGTVEATPGNPLTDDIVASEVLNGTATTAALNATIATGIETSDYLPATFSQLPVTNPAGLDKWRKALGKRRTTPVKIAVTGNSNWEGTGAPDYADRFQTILQDRLRQRYQPAGVTGAKDPNIHLAGMSPVPANPPYTLTGSASGSQYGLGGRGFKLVTGTTVTIPFTGDRVLVRYFKASGGGILNIVLDGGAPVLIDTYSASGVYTHWDSGALTAGAHTLTITRDASTQAGRDIFICDVETFNGDYTKGIRVYDAARHGVTANGLYASQGGWNVEFQNIGGWSLLVIGLGENDTALTKEQYKTEVLAFIAWIRGYGFASSILLVHGPVPGAYNVANWAAFGEAEKEIAEADADVAYLDLSVRIPGYDTGGNTLGLYYDTKHKNDAGQAWQADVITEVLTTR